MVQVPVSDEACELQLTYKDFQIHVGDFVFIEPRYLNFFVRAFRHVNVWVLWTPYRVKVKNPILLMQRPTHLMRSSTVTIILMYRMRQWFVGGV